MGKRNILHIFIRKKNSKRIMIKICTGNTELVVKGGKTTVENIQEIILEMHMVNKLVFKHYSNLRITPPRTNLCCCFCTDGRFIFG